MAAINTGLQSAAVPSATRYLAMRGSKVPGMAKVPDPVEPLLLCPKCKTEMLVFGIEPEKPGRDLYTFECPACRHLEVRGASTV